MSQLYRFFACSEHPVARWAREARRRVQSFSLPAPRPLIVPALGLFLAARGIYHFGARVLVCEPLFKAYCSRVGRGVRTGVFVHWVQGKGDIELGDGVLIDGKCSFSFAARFCERPTLTIGDRTEIGHNCRFTVGKRISIGRDCRISSDVWLFDSAGHPADPAERLAGLPVAESKVRPVVIGDNVWIGSRSVVFPGVTIGNGSVAAAGSVITSSVPPDTVVAGNPARRIWSLRRSARQLDPTDSESTEEPTPCARSQGPQPMEANA